MKEDIKLLLAYVKNFLSQKKLIFTVLLLFLIIALGDYFLSPKEYVSKTSFIAQVSSESGAGSGLKNIADLIGVNLGGKKEQKDLPVFLYPKLMKSLPYNRELTKSQFQYRKADSLITIGDYYITYYKPSIGSKVRKYTIGLPGLIIRKLRSKEPKSNRILIDSLTYISKEEAMLFSRLSEDITFGVDDLDGSISITVKMLDPELAAQVCEKATSLLQKEIIGYRLGKAQERYNFINTQYLEKKENYSRAQVNLARYIDRNKFNNTESSLVRRRELENETNLAFAIYSELESQRIVEQINLNENTPVFTMLQPAIVPLEPINASIFTLLIKYLAIGFICSVLVYIFLIIRTQFKTLWRGEDYDNTGEINLDDEGEHN